MITKRVLIAVTVLFCAQTSFAQFGNTQAQSGRLIEMADRLSREASDFAANNYRTYSSSFRSNRSDIEGVMLGEQFSGASRIFYRMVVDRRRNQDLRDAFNILQQLGSAVERSNLNRSSWSNVQRLMTDVGREIDMSGNDGPGPGYPGPGGSGRMTWRGKVDDDVRIIVRGGRADVETIGGTPYYDAQPNFTASLPSRRVNVTLNMKKGRGTAYIEQQPSRENDFSVVIRVKDPKGGASDYELEISW